MSHGGNGDTCTPQKQKVCIPTEHHGIGKLNTGNQRPVQRGFFCPATLQVNVIGMVDVCHSEERWRAENQRLLGGEWR